MSSKQAQRIGLVAGLGPEATVHYYRQLLRAHEERGAVMDLVMIQADMRRVVEYVKQGDKAGLALYLGDLLASLRGAGAQIGAIPAVTPHLCSRELEPLSPLPLVNILETTAAELAARNLGRVAIFGTRFTVQSALFGQLEGVVSVAQPRPEEIERIHDIYFGLATKGKAGEHDGDELTSLAHELIRREHVDAIVLAGTDFAVLFNGDNVGFPHVDCGQAQIREIMRQALQ